MKNIFITFITLFIGYTSFAQKLNCVDYFYVSLFTECKLTQQYDDDLSSKIESDLFSKSVNSSALNKILGTDYPQNEQIYPCYRKQTEFGYSLIVQRVNKEENTVKINLILVDKMLNFIDNKLLGEKQLYHSYENVNARKHYFMFSSNTTLEVNCKVMNETYSNTIDEFSNNYSISKEGIVCIEDVISQ